MSEAAAHSHDHEPPGSASGTPASGVSSRGVSASGVSAPGDPIKAGRALPGDRAPHVAVEQMIRVDHAGEYGAARIYAGQLAVLGRRGVGDTIRHMQAQEQRHLTTFNDLIGRRRVRPTALLPLWHVAGFALGAVTAALGEKAAMACTVAVEEAIDAHYAQQIEELDSSEAALRDTIKEFRSEELEHRDIGLAGGAEQMPGYRLLSNAIRLGCRVAIGLSEKI